MARIRIDNESPFRFFVVIAIFIIFFSLMWNVKEIRENRTNSWHNRSVSCATLKGALLGLAQQNQHDKFMEDVYEQECEKDHIIPKEYPNAIR